VLPKLCTMEWLASYGLTEPGARKLIEGNA
jgi:hypothetical protein